MDFGRISRHGDPIGLAEWNEVIASSAYLEQMPGRTMRNPFTGEEIVDTGEGRAYYVLNDKKRGAASLENGEILTDGIPRDICEQLSQRLGAIVLEDDRS